jgi:hypothetical protein
VVDKIKKALNKETKMSAPKSTSTTNTTNSSSTQQPTPPTTTSTSTSTSTSTKKPGTLIDLRHAWETDGLESAEVKKTDTSSYLRLKDGTTFEFGEKQVLFVDGEERMYDWGALWLLLRHGFKRDGTLAEIRDYLHQTVQNRINKIVPSKDREAVVLAIKTYGEGGTVVSVKQPGVWGNWPPRGIVKREDTIGHKDSRDVATREAFYKEHSFEERVLKKAISYYDRNDVLRTARVLTAVQEIDAKSRDLEAQNRHLLKKQRTIYLGNPIIVVPPQLSAILNLYNIKQFLIDRRFVSVKEIRSKEDGTTTSKPVDLTITREHPRVGPVAYTIVDSTIAFNEQDWNRVVAVIVSGEGWELRGWKWPDMAEIFQHCRGIFVYFDDDKVPEHVRSWNVALLPLKRDSRYKDPYQAKSLWELIDHHMSTSPFHQKLMNNLIEQAEQRAREERERNLARLRKNAEAEEEMEGGGVMMM